MPEPGLKALQRAMSAVVQHPRDSAFALRTRAGRPLAGHVKPSPTMQPHERLDVYNGGYLARLVEALETDYPALRHALDRHAFVRLIAAYVTRHPSRHPNLNRFGKRLPEFVARHLAHRRRAFLAELARLERAVTLAFDAPEFTPLDTKTIATADPARLVLVPNPSLQALQLDYPANAYLQGVLDERSPRIPSRKRSFVAVYRKDGRVWRANLTAPMHAVLAALLAQKPLAKALAHASAAPAEVTRWFGEWASEGFFVSARLASRSRGRRQEGPS